MIDRLKSFLIYGNIFIGIEHSFDNTDVINISKLKKNKNEIELECYFEVSNILEVVNALKGKNNVHASLVINNNNVLTKQIDSINEEHLKLVYKAFPNIKLEDFYFEILTQNNQHFISLCRKDYLNTIITTYQKHNLYIINISLGNNLAESISNFFDVNHIYTSNSKIEFINNRIIKINRCKTLMREYNINGLKILNRQLLSFVAGLESILNNKSLNNKSLKSNLLEEKKNLLKEYKKARFFSQFLKFGVLFIFSLLLINFLVFNFYFNKAEELSDVSEINFLMQERIKTLNETILKKQSIVEDLLKSKKSKSSFYSNQIAKSIPHSVLLTDLNYQPLKRRLKEDKIIQVEKFIIVISGVSTRIKEFSNWISELEEKDWVKKIEIIDYLTNTSQSSSFKIKIFLNGK